MTIHKGFSRGTSIFITFKDGRPHLIGKYLESGSRWLKLYSGEKIYFKDIKSTGINR